MSNGTRPPHHRLLLSLLLLAGASLVSGTAAQAQMTLTSAAVCRGFTLTTFASDFVTDYGEPIGPLGVAYVPNGEVLVTFLDQASLVSTIFKLPNHNDGQVGPFPVSTTYPYGDAIAMAQTVDAGQPRYFLGQQVAGKILEVDATGVQIAVIASGINRPTGIAPYPPAGSLGFDGHLFVTDEDANIWDVDTSPPAAPVLFAGATGSGADGLSFSPDGTKLYVAYVNEGMIRAFDVATGAMTWESCSHPGGPDGTSIGLGTLTGYLYVNCNNGSLWEVGLPGTPHESEATLLATGGSRGDFIAADPNVLSGGSFPSLLLTQSDQILRLDPPGGGFFGPPTSSTDPVLAVAVPPRAVSGVERASAFPNPFATETRVAFTLATDGVVDVSIHDVAGRLTRTLFSGRLLAGPQDLPWDGLDSAGRRVNAGVYFVRVRLGDRLLDTRVVSVR